MPKPDNWAHKTCLVKDFVALMFIMLHKVLILLTVENLNLKIEFRIESKLNWIWEEVNYSWNELLSRNY